MFGVPAEIDFSRLYRVTQNVRRVFYYDCLNDIQGEKESESDFKLRVDKQQDLFDPIQGLPGFHVRLGSVSGGSPRKLRQKKVDVLLVVDALDHAFRGNMSQACLIAGDLDFAPLVDSLIKLGTYVQVLYEPRSGARGLYSAADIGQPITFSTVYGWSSSRFCDQHPIPSGIAGGPAPMHESLALVKSGLVNDQSISLHKTNKDHFLYCQKYGPHSLLLRFPDAALLEKYFSFVYGPIDWRS